MPRPKPSPTTLRVCAYPGCPGAGLPQPLENFPIVKGESRRQYCKPCYRAWKKDTTRHRRCRRASEGVPDAPPLYGRACGGCPELARCQGERLWAKPEPLPCELLLPDEVGVEYEGGELTAWPGAAVEVTLRLDFVRSV